MVRRPAWLFPSRFGLIAAAIALLLATPASALDKVSLQLKWKHQFQFAGYYMALEKGFYRDAGLDVEIREGGPGIDAAKDLEDGKADFGVCTTSVLLAKAGRPTSRRARRRLPALRGGHPDPEPRRASPRRRS